MLDEKINHIYNIILSIFLGLFTVLLFNYLFIRIPVIDVNYPKII